MVRSKTRYSEQTNTVEDKNVHVYGMYAALCWMQRFVATHAFNTIREHTFVCISTSIEPVLETQYELFSLHLLRSRIKFAFKFCTLLHKGQQSQKTIVICCFPFTAEPINMYTACRAFDESCNGHFRHGGCVENAN